MRSWLDYNPDPIAGVRPTVTRRRFLPQRRNIWSGGRLPTQAETYQQPVVSPSEIIDTIRERFNRQPLTRRGNIVTRSMQRPEMPLEMARKTRFGSYFQPQASNIPVGTPFHGWRPSPAQSDMLTASWVLPKESRFGATNIQRNIPASDRARALAYSAGISNIGGRFSTLNPATYWPESAFKVPMRPSGSPRIGNLPVFDSVIDYSTGKWYSPPSAWGRTQQYGRFGAGAKTTPTFGQEYKIRARPRRTEWDKYNQWRRGQQMAGDVGWQAAR